MPSALVNKVKEKCNMTKDKAESLGNRAKDKAKEQGHEEEGDYIMGIYHKIIGKKCVDKLGGEVKETRIDNLIKKYL